MFIRYFWHEYTPADTKFAGVSQRVMYMIFYAKSNPVETIQKHTDEAIRRLHDLKEMRRNILSENDWNVLYYAVLFHDLGKIDVKFQNMICLAIKEPLLKDLIPEQSMIPHNYLSGALVDNEVMKTKFDKQDMQILHTAIYYHHNRENDETDEERRKYLASSVALIAREYYEDKISIPAKINSNYLKYIDCIKDMTDDLELANRYMKIKGLLNRIDYCASAHTSIENNPKKTISVATIDFMERTNRFPLRPAQQYMLDHQSENVVLIASTGSGKTEAALLWLGEDKGFYTLPLKVSINAIYDRIHKGMKFSEVSLLHSDALSYYLNRTKDASEEDVMMQYRESKLFAAPLTVCTIDQLFKFVYKYNGGEMALATLSYSKLIIDEIQTYSPELVATILYGLKMICDVGGKFAIITATFPPILYDFMDSLGIMKKPKLQTFFYGNVSHRHRICILPNHTFAENQILSLGKTKKVLVIVNTVSAAQRLYKSISGQGVSVHLLHSMFIRRDRRKLEQAILNFAPNDKVQPESGIWISTQIVEASLDIDFDVLFTEMCPIDQLMQRLGRVFRCRDYFGQEPNVYILENRNGVSGKNTGVIDAELYERSLTAVRNVLSDQESVLLIESQDTDLKQEMINYVYGEEIKRTGYFKKIQRKLDDLKNTPFYCLSKEDADNKFREIDSRTLIPRSIYELEKKTIDQLIQIADNKQTPFPIRQKAREDLLEYTVNISYYQGLDIDYTKQLFTHSNIYFYNGGYEFNPGSMSGVGIIKKYGNKQGFMVNDLFL